MLNYLERYEILRRYEMLGRSIIEGNSIVSKPLLQKLDEILDNVGVNFSNNDGLILLLSSSKITASKANISNNETLININSKEKTSAIVKEMMEDSIKKTNDVNEIFKNIELVNNSTNPLIDDIVSRVNYRTLRNWWIKSTMTISDIRSAFKTKINKENDTTEYELINWSKNELSQQLKNTLLGIIIDSNGDEKQIMNFQKSLNNSIIKRLQEEMVKVHTNELAYNYSQRTWRYVTNNISLAKRIDGGNDVTKSELAKERYQFNKILKPKKPTGGKP